MKTIKETRRLTHRMAISLLSVFMAATLTGCVGDDSLCPEDQQGFDEKEVVWMTLGVNFQNVSSSEHADQNASDTRATDDENHPDDISTPAENYINRQDLMLVIFDHNYNVIKTIGPGDFLDWSESADKTSYQIITQIHRDYFRLIESGEKFPILAVANYATGATPGAPSFKAEWMTNLDKLASDCQTFNFEPSSTWEPSIDSHNGIPMAGLMIHNGLSEDDLDKAIDKSSALTLGSIEMQRSMAKIRILDNLPYQLSLETSQRIKSVRLVKGNVKGALIPDTKTFTGWKQGTKMLEYATVPTPALAWQKSDMKIDGQYNGENFEKDQKTYREFRMYTPEIRTYTGNLTDASLEITVEERSWDSKNDADWKERKTYTCPLATILGRVNNGDVRYDIARNHVYEFVVSSTEKADISVTYTVCDWIDKQTAIEFN